MNKKNIVWIIIALVLLVFLGFIGHAIFINSRINPKIEGLSKFNIGIFYCSYNDDVNKAVNRVSSRLKTKSTEITPTKNYPKNQNEFIERIKQENGNIASITLNKYVADFTKYDYIILGTPVIDNKPCPAMQKFIVDNQSRFEKKPVSVIVLYKEGELPGNTVQYFYDKLYGVAIWKPPFVTKFTATEKMFKDIDLWFNTMEFKRFELK